MKNAGAPNTPIVLGILGLFGLLFMGLFGLVALGRDIGQVVYYVGPFILTLGGILAALLRVNSLESKTDEQTEKIDNIHENVNGKLDKKFSDLADMIQAVNNKVDLQRMGNVGDPIDKGSLDVDNGDTDTEGITHE